MTFSDLPLATALTLGGVAAYLLGSIPSAVWIGRSFYGVDVREKGSRNAGTTNTMRVLGLLPGLFVLAVDVFKGWLAVYFAKFFGSSLAEIEPDYLVYYQLVVGAFAVIGHALPVFAGFKGGKGVATMLGVVIGLFDKIIPLVLAVFVLVFILTHFISVSSMCAAVSFPIFYSTCSIWLHYNINTVQLVFSVIVALFILWTHRKNIRRLRKGEEPKFKFKKTVD